MATNTRPRSSLVRVRMETQEKLRALAGDRPITQLLDELVEGELRRRRLQAFNDAYMRLKADPAAWAAYRAEQQELDGTAADGLDEDGEEWDESLVDAATW